MTNSTSFSSAICPCRTCLKRLTPFSKLRAWWQLALPSKRCSSAGTRPRGSASLQPSTLSSSCELVTWRKTTWASSSSTDHPSTLNISTSLVTNGDQLCKTMSSCTCSGKARKIVIFTTLLPLASYSFRCFVPYSRSNGLRSSKNSGSRRTNQPGSRGS